MSTSNGKRRQPPAPPSAERRELHGIGGSPGISVAPAVVVRSRIIDVPKITITPDRCGEEWQRAELARARTREQLKQLRSRLDSHAKNGEAGIMDAHLMVLDDEMITKQLRHEIMTEHRNAEWAIQNVSNTFIRQFLQADDPYLKERAEDISDVGRRFIRNLMGITEELPVQWTDPCIVVAENLTPSEAIALPREHVRGIALERGSLTSHAALIARAFEIPAVFGLGGITGIVKNGELLGLDGGHGLVIVNPSPDDLTRLNDTAAIRAGLQRDLDTLKDLPAVTLDGRRIPMLANIENVDEMASLEAHGAEGIGLFRTEYLWMATGRPVSEEQQTAAYAAAVAALRGRPLVIRAFDLGGDKFVGNGDAAPPESNPFLGVRSIRYLLRHPEVFKTQLRAVLRARNSGDVRLMIPMVSDVSEIIRSRELLDECMAEITAAGEPCPPIKLGIMVEVPAAALAADHLAEHADFFDIGTNDLTQYTLAADRINANVIHLYQPTHPAVLRLVAMTVEAGHRHGIPVGVCGEMASDPALALLLVGMGADVLSMAPSSIPGVKSAIRKVTLEQTRDLAARVHASRSPEETLELCRALLNVVAPELLRLV